MSGGQQKGVTLIETLMGMVLLILLLSLAAPSYTTWIRNNQIRTAAESILNGLQLARAEAIKRNTLVRFQLTSDLTNSCTISSNGNNWVISMDSAASACGASPSDTTAPRIIQKRTAQEGSAATSVTATLTGGSAASVIFDSFGRVQSSSLTSSISRIDISISGSTAGTFRDLRVAIAPGGRIVMCDPAVTAAGDTRLCP